MDNNTIIELIIIGLNTSKNKIKHVINDIHNTNTTIHENALLINEILSDTLIKIKTNIKVLNEIHGKDVELSIKQTLVNNILVILKSSIINIYSIYEKNMYVFVTKQYYIDLCSSLLSVWLFCYKWIKHYYDYELNMQIQELHNDIDNFNKESDNSISEFRLIKILLNKIDIPSIFNTKDDTYNKIKNIQKILNTITILIKKHNIVKFNKKLNKYTILLNTWCREWNVSNVFFIKYNNYIKNITI